jgi:hypothetical protein
VASVCVVASAACIAASFAMEVPNPTAAPMILPLLDIVASVQIVAPDAYETTLIFFNER